MREASLKKLFVVTRVVILSLVLYFVLFQARAVKPKFK